MSTTKGSNKKFDVPRNVKRIYATGLFKYKEAVNLDKRLTQKQVDRFLESFDIKEDDEEFSRILIEREIENKMPL